MKRGPFRFLQQLLGWFDPNMIRPGDEIYPVREGDWLVLHVQAPEGFIRRRVPTGYVYTELASDDVQKMADVIAMVACGGKANITLPELPRDPTMYTIIDPEA